jgi:hypothetical protein
MRHLRFLLILMGLWIILFDDIGRMVGIPALTPYASMIVTACAVFPLLFPATARSARFAMFTVAVLSLLLLYVWQGRALHETNLLVVTVEVAVIGLTIVLASTVGAQINGIQQALIDLGLGQLQNEVESFEAGQQAIYREIRWARRSQQPMALLAISISDQSIERLLDQKSKPGLTHKLVREAQGEVWRSYAMTQVAKLLLAELDDTAIVAKRRHYFVVALPGADREQSSARAERIKTISDIKLETKLNIGVAVFPNDAVTFESLLERAEAAMTGMDAAPGIVLRPEAANGNRAASDMSDVRKKDEITSPV